MRLPIRPRIRVRRITGGSRAGVQAGAISTPILASFMLACVAGCSDSGDPPTAAGENGGTDPVSFSADVQPILTQSCATGSCHAAPNPSAGMDLSADTAYANLVGVTASGNPDLQRVAAGSAEDSFLYLKLLGQGTSIMPPGGSLPAAQIETIRTWIDEGAEEN